MKRTIEIDNIDLALLDEQRIGLYQILSNHEEVFTQNEVDYLDGLINMLEEVIDKYSNEDGSYKND